MNKLILTSFLLIIILANNTNAQTDTTLGWKTSASMGLTFNQVAFVNWAKGGENTISGISFANLYANLKQKNWGWDNYLLLSYGLMKQGEESKIRKTEDKIEFNSKIGYKQWENVFWTFLANFKSQFTEGYNYPNDSVVVSKFFAPAYQILSLGVDYKVNDRLSIYLSPATGRYIFVSDTLLSPRYGLKTGETVKPEFGWYFTSSYKHDNIIENVNLSTKLSLFQNFTDVNKANRKNVDIDWQTQIQFKVNKFLSAQFRLDLLYDHDIQVQIYETIDGVKTLVGTGPRTQFMEQFGFGIVFNF